MQIARTCRLAAGLALLALAPGCARYGFQQQELGLRHDAASDTLEVVVVSHGLTSTGSSSAERVARNAAGGRHVILGGWPFDFDLDEIDAQLADDDHPLAPRARDFLRGIEVTEAGTWVEEEGRVALWQRLRIPRAGEGLALLSDLINETLLAEGVIDEADESFGRKTADLLEAHARAGRPWAAFEGGALVVRAPMSPEGAARALEGVIELDDCLPFARALSAVSVADGFLTLTFAPDAQGWIRLRIDDASAQEQPALTPPLDPPPVRALPAWLAAFLQGDAPAGAEKR